MPFFDGTNERIYYRLWEVDEPVAGVVFLHGGGEHSGQYSRLASALNARNVNVWAPDHQGHGISGGAPHDSGGVGTIVKDVRLLLGRVRADFPDLPLVIGGHSLGGWTTAATLLDDPSPYSGAIIVGASLQEVDVSARFLSDGDNLFFDTSILATDPGYLEELEKDPLVHLTIPKTTRVTSSLDDSVAALEAEFPKVQLPVFFINGTKDVLGPIESARHWAGRLPNARLLEIEDGLHNVVNDVDYRQVQSAIADFVVEVTQ